MRLRLLPYKMTSESGRDLARAIDAIRLYPEGSRFVQRSDDVIINWGCGYQGNQSIIPSLNSYDAVRTACNKLATLKKFSEASLPCPDWTIHKAMAQDWILHGFTVYCRTTLTGRSGRGIIIASTLEGLVDAPLYTKQVDAGREYRVHVFNGKVIDYAKKAKKRSELDAGRCPPNSVRSYSTGWVFVRKDIELPEVVAQTAIKAVASIGLDFGAVDICCIKGTHSQTCCVYEVNTACGLTNATLNSYVEAINKWIIERR